MEKNIIVYQNIEDSPFFFQYENYKFYFSSQFYRRNFMNRIDNYILEESYKIKNRYKIINDKFFEILKEVLLVSFYKKIEKRGFRIYINEERYKENGK